MLNLYESIVIKIILNYDLILDRNVEIGQLLLNDTYPIKYPYCTYVFRH